MPDLKPAAVRRGGVEDAVAHFDGDAYRLLEVNRLARLERGDGGLYVQVIGGGDENAVEVVARRNVASVAGDGQAGAELLAVGVEHGVVQVAHRGEVDVLIGAVGGADDPAAAARADGPKL